MIYQLINKSNIKLEWVSQQRLTPTSSKLSQFSIDFRSKFSTIFEYFLLSAFLVQIEIALPYLKSDFSWLRTENVLDLRLISMISGLIKYSDIHEDYVFQEYLDYDHPYFTCNDYSRVRKAIYIYDDSPFAIKIFNKKKAENDLLESFLQECEANILLVHPNIVEVYEIYDSPDYLYIVMEYCEGGTLNSPQNKHRLSTEKQIADVVLTITNALEFIHSQGRAHHRVKPQNIVWTTKDEKAVLKIIDFGSYPRWYQIKLWRHIGYKFQSPQILLGRCYNSKIDFWSLGVITYVLLSGQLPFKDANYRERFKEITSQSQIQFPESKWKYVSCAAKDFIVRLLKRNPSQRYQAAEIRKHPWILSEYKEQPPFCEFREKLYRQQEEKKIEKIKQTILTKISEIIICEKRRQIGLPMS